MQKTDFALFKSFALLWCQVWCHILHYLAQKVKPIWLIQFKMWGFAGSKYWILSNLMQICGYLWPRQGLVCIFLTFDKSLGFYLVPFLGFVRGCQLNWIHWDRVWEIGCGLVPCPIILHLVYRSPRHPMVKLWDGPYSCTQVPVDIL